MTDCSECERVREMLLETLKVYVSGVRLDRCTGPSVTNEEMMEIIIGILKEKSERIDDLT